MAMPIPKMNEQLRRRSPFEIKYDLIEIAQKAGHVTIHDVSRGNPDFFAAKPRRWVAELLNETLAYTRELGLIDEYQHKTGILSIHQMALLIEKVDPDYAMEEIIYDLHQAVIGTSYPVPDRVLRFNEKIQDQFVKKIMNLASGASLEIFPTAGGADAMGNVFSSLKSNGLLHSEDKIAMLTPIFTPYLEIPLNAEYGNEIVSIETFEDNHWQPTVEALNKLLDPEVKLLCVVNPGNPSGVALNEETINVLKNIVLQRPELMIITDDVYCTFVDKFEGLFKHLSFNTLLVYSFSKYFGATGQRLGMVVLHEDNVFDKQLQRKKRLSERYKHIAVDPSKMRFIDRMVADSRSVGLNHVAGLSLPQQLTMCLFSYMYLVEGETYHKKLMNLMKERFQALAKVLDCGQLENDPLYDRYYFTYHLGDIGISDIEFAQRLAEKYGIIVFAASGFYQDLVSDKTQIRISLANASSEILTQVACAIKEMQSMCQANEEKI